MYKLTTIGVLIRFAWCVMMVAGTYNPTGYSMTHWFLNPASGSIPGKIMLGLVMLLMYAVYYMAVMNSLGRGGTYGLLAFFGAAIWQMVEWGWFDIHNIMVMQLIGMLVLAVMMTIGVCWTQVRQQLTGQLDLNFDD